MSNFAVTSSPHLRDKATSQRIMQEVCLALAPAGIAGIILYGFNAALLIAICVATCVLSEFVWQKATKQTVTISDWSAVVTGLLLAYNLPATAPWWVAVIGSIIAIVLVKQFFGGIGSNFMNPALTARAILFISWSGIMGAYPKAQPMQFFADAVTGATPLATLNGGTTEGLNLLDLLLGNHGGVLGETCAITIILGGIYLIWTKVISPVIPVTYLATVAVLSVCFGMDPIYQLLSGGLVNSRHISGENPVTLSDGTVLTETELLDQLMTTLAADEKNRVWLLDTVMRLAPSWEHSCASEGSLSPGFQMPE